MDKTIIKAFSTLPLPEYKTEAAAGLDLCACFHGTAETGFAAYDGNNQPVSFFEEGWGLYNHKSETAHSTLQIPPRHRVKIPTGLYTQGDLRQWYAVVLRSGFAWEKGLIIPNAVGVIDSDYRGQWFLVLFNPLDVPVTIKHGERIAQLIPIAAERIELQLVGSRAELTDTQRGDGGFGSTGE